MGTEFPMRETGKSGTTSENIYHLLHKFADGPSFEIKNSILIHNAAMFANVRFH
jgi:hypothetical protein